MTETMVITFKQVKNRLKKEEPKLHEYLLQKGVQDDNDLNEIKEVLWTQGNKEEFYAYSLHSFLLKYMRKYGDFWIA